MQTTPPPIPPIPPIPTSISIPPPIPKPHTPILRTTAIVVAAVVGLLAAGFVGSIAFRHVSQQAVLRANHDKVEVIRKVQSLRLAVNSSEAKTLCTQKGFAVWTAMQQRFPEASAGFTVVGFKNSGELSEVAMIRDTIEGVSRVHVRLIRTGTQWRFEDIYCSELQGRRMDMWASEAVEHPFLAFARFNKLEIEAAAKGFMGAIKGAAEAARDISDIIKAFKGK